MGGEDHLSVEAEVYGLLQVVQPAVPLVHYVADSVLVVRGVGRGRAWNTRVNQVQADSWLAIWECVEDWQAGSLSASHVKAHRNRAVLQDSNSTERLKSGI